MWSRALLPSIIVLASSALLAAPASAGRSAEAAPAPMAMCDEAWLDRYNERTSERYQGTVVQPEALIAALATAVVERGGNITLRRERGDNHELHFQLTEPFDVVAIIEPFEPSWTNRESSMSSLQLENHCDQLVTAQRVAERLSTWMAETDDVREKQLVSSLHANVASQLQRSQDTLIRTERNPQHTVVVAFAKSAAQ